MQLQRPARGGNFVPDRVDLVELRVEGVVFAIANGKLSIEQRHKTDEVSVVGSGSHERDHRYILLNVASTATPLTRV